MADAIIRRTRRARGFAWYPVLEHEGRNPMLAYAVVNAEDSELLELAIVLDLEDGTELRSEEWDSWVYDRFEGLLLDVATNAGHESWKGFEAFREIAFPRPKDLPPLPEVRCLTHNARAQAALSEFVEALKRPLPTCKHTLGDLIGGAGSITQCAGCIQERSAEREARRAVVGLDEARARGLPGWNIRCNVCGSFGADWIPDLRPGWGALAACPSCAALIEREQKRHRDAMAQLAAVRFEQPTRLDASTWGKHTGDDHK